MIIGNPITLGGTKKKGRLPEEYQEVEYLESTGTQYIDTAFRLQSIDYVRIEYKAITYPSSSAYSIYGARDADDTNVMQMYANYNGFMGYRQNSKGYGDVSFQPAISGTLIIGGGSINFTNRSGQESTITYDNITVVTNHSCFLFTAHDAVTGTTTFAIAKIKLFAIARGGVDRLGLISCYRKSDYKPGMYDIVSDIFITNSGTGEFTVGPDVV